MRYEDDLRQGSFEKGIHQERQVEALEISKNMLLEGFKVDFIAKVTHLSTNEILKLSENH